MTSHFALLVCGIQALEHIIKQYENFDETDIELQPEHFKRCVGIVKNVITKLKRYCPSLGRILLSFIDAKSQKVKTCVNVFFATTESKI